MSLQKICYLYSDWVRKEASAAGEQLVQCQNPIRTGNKAEIAVFAALSLSRKDVLFLGKKKLEKPNTNWLANLPNQPNY